MMDFPLTISGVIIWTVDEEADNVQIVAKGALVMENDAFLESIRGEQQNYEQGVRSLLKAS